MSGNEPETPEWEWLWPKFLEAGEHTMFIGETGEQTPKGKSTFRLWPGDPEPEWEDVPVVEKPLTEAEHDARMRADGYEKDRTGRGGWVRAVHTCPQGPLCAVAGHDCPRARFLDDPITRSYGVGSEMVHLIACPVCDATDGGQCDHGSCVAIVHEYCHACMAAARAASAAGSYETEGQFWGRQPEIPDSYRW